MSCPEVGGGVRLAMGAWKSRRHLIGEPRKKMAKDTIEAGRSGMCKGGASGEKKGRNGSVKSEDPWSKETVPPPEKQFRTEGWG